MCNVPVPPSLTKLHFAAQLIRSRPVLAKCSYLTFSILRDFKSSCKICFITEGNMATVEAQCIVIIEEVFLADAEHVNVSSVSLLSAQVL